MKIIRDENNDWKEKWGNLHKDVNDIKDSVELAHNLISDETRDKKEAMNQLKTEMNERAIEATNNVKVMKTHSAEIKKVNDSVNRLQTKVDKLAETEIIGPLKKLKADVEEKVGNIEFPIKTTIVGQNVWYREDEDLEKVAETIIHKGLELPEIHIIRVTRKSGKEKGKGLIKIELNSNDEVKKVLKNKSKLKQSNVKELREVYLRQSKKEELLVMERNQDVILRELGVRDEYVRLPSGHLALKSTRAHPDGQHLQRETRHGARGGMCWGFNPHSPWRHAPHTAVYLASGNAAGPHIGVENADDPRIAQADEKERHKMESKDTPIEEFMQ